MSYIRVRSWHVVAKVDAVGWRTRCGLTITTEDAPVSDRLPLEDPSCESCARLTLHDADATSVPNDEVTS